MGTGGVHRSASRAFELPTQRQARGADAIPGDPACPRPAKPTPRFMSSLA